MARDADLVVQLVQVTVAAIDVALRNLTGEREHRRVERLRGQHRRARIEETGTGHDGKGLRPPGRHRGAERHIGRALFVARVQQLQPILRAIKGVEQRIVVDARQREHLVDAGGYQRLDGRLGRGERRRRVSGGF